MHTREKCDDAKAGLNILITVDELALRLRYKSVEALRAVLRTLGPKDGVYKHGQRHILINWPLYYQRLCEGKLGTDE